MVVEELEWSKECERSRQAKLEDLPKPRKGNRGWGRWWGRLLEFLREMLEEGDLVAFFDMP
jgi:hypothetical protein